MKNGKPPFMIAGQQPRFDPATPREIGPESAKVERYWDEERQVEGDCVRDHRTVAKENQHARDSADVALHDVPLRQIRNEL